MAHMSDIVYPPPGFKTTRFWRDCRICKGFGIVPAHHQYAAPVEVKLTGNIRDGGQSGDTVDDPNKSYCAACKGCGMELK